MGVKTVPRVLSNKQIEARKFSRLIDSGEVDREALRNKLAEEVAAWEAAGGKVQQIPIGASGIKGSVFASYAKTQVNGLKKDKGPKKGNRR